MDPYFVYTLIAIFVVSVVMAVRSMRDFSLPKEIRYWIDSRRVKGSIVFFRKDVRHYKQGKKEVNN